MQIYHRCCYISMTQELFYGNDIDTFFKQMRGIAVTQRMKIDFLTNTSISPGFMHNPAKTLKAVTPIWFFAIEKINMRFLNFKIFL